MTENNSQDNTNSDATEKVLWSIAIPGFGQFLNREFFKGTIFIALEFVINTYAHLNRAIILSFQGDISGAVRSTNYQWLLFYPCVYMFAISDAYKGARNLRLPFSYLPFVFPAFFGTIGIIYSPDFKIMGYLLGPVWLPILFALVGSVGGILLRRLLR